MVPSKIRIKGKELVQLNGFLKVHPYFLLIYHIYFQELTLKMTGCLAREWPAARPALRGVGGGGPRSDTGAEPGLVP